MLFVACERGNLEEVKRIIKVNQDAGDEWNNGGFVDGQYQKPNLKWLLDEQSDIGLTPIMFAARHGHIDIVEYLDKLGASLKLNYNYDTLHMACFGQNLDIV